MIDAQGLTKTFRTHRKEPGLLGSVKAIFKRQWVVKEALRNVSLRVDSGEIVGLVGPNGAGKTTLVKILTGIIHPTAGRARVLGHVPWERRVEFRREIALIMGQKAQLWWDLPAADCFLLLKEIYRIPDRRYRETLDDLTERLGVGPQLRTQIRRLSLGERMKMELIAALLHRPKVVFLDEPTIGLDLPSQRAIREFLLQYRREHKPAMIVTSHYMEDIEKLCRRVVIMREGGVIYDGALEKAMRRYATHKTVTAQVAAAAGGGHGGRAPEVPAAVGEVVEWAGGALKLRVPREGVARAATYLLGHFEVTDLNISETDVGTVIENILTSGGPAP